MTNHISKAYIILFVSTLAVFGFGVFYDWDSKDNCENRKLAEMPSFSFSQSYFIDLESYVTDHFSFRNRLADINSTIRWSIFNSSIKPDQVQNGKDSFLFYTSNTDYLYKSLTRQNLLSAKDLIALDSTLVKRKEYLAQKGIDYFMAVWPNKSSIYPEYLPTHLKKHIQDTISRVDQITHYLSSHSGIKVIEAYALLKAIKLDDSTSLYLKNDTHWNNKGAFFAYQSLMKGMNMIPYNLEDFNIENQEVVGGDLVNLLGLCNQQSFIDKDLIFTFKDASIKTEKLSSKINNMHIRRNYALNEGKTILIFRDSFTSAMLPFIQLHFKECFVVWSSYNEGLVNKLKPDIVLVSKTERYF